MSAISVAQAHRVTELAFMGFLFFLLRNVMSAISVAQARRVAEQAFMGFLFFLLRNVMTVISVAQARRVLAFMTFKAEISLIQSHGQCYEQSRINMEKHNISSLSRVQGSVGTWQETLSFQWVGSSRMSTQQRSLRDYPEWNGSVVLKLNWGLLTGKTRLSSFLQHPQECWGGLLRRTVWLAGTPANISAKWYSPRFRQKSEQLMQRESRTSGEPLLPVSRRPSHWEMISQRNSGAPSRIPNRISPWWFTWQTVAWLLCSRILTHTMPWRHLLIEIAPSQFIKGDQADHMGHKLSGKLHKLGPCQKLLTTKSDLTQMTT